MLVCIMTVSLKLRSEMLLTGLLSVKITFFCHSNNVLPWMIPEYPLASEYLILFIYKYCFFRTVFSEIMTEIFIASISVVKQVSKASCSILLHLSYWFMDWLVSWYSLWNKKVKTAWCFFLNTFSDCLCLNVGLFSGSCTV